MIHHDLADHRLAETTSARGGLRTDGTRSKDVETELETGGAYSTRTFDWVYDQLGRLTEEKLTSSLSGESYTDDYTYSLVGNRVELKATAASGTVTDTTSSYNTRDQLLQENAVASGSTTTTNIQYDANGSLTSKITVGGNSYGYTYNLRNQLATATIDRTEQGHAVHITASYKYNDAGIRVENDETTTIDNGAPTAQTKLFLIDGNNPTGYAQVLEQLAAAAGQAVISYIFGHQPLGQTDSSGATKYILADGHDSTRLLVDAAAAIAARFLYDAYGDILGPAPGVLNLPATSILYTGQLFDPVLLQYYLRARYYDPAAGAFTSRDPFAGMSLDPVTLHRYLYGGDDPVDRDDPTGQFIGYATYISLGLALLSTAGGTYLGAQAGKPIRGFAAGGILGAGIMIANINKRYAPALAAGFFAAATAGLITAAFEYASHGNNVTEADIEHTIADFRFTVFEAFSYAFFNSATGIDAVERGNLALQSLPAILQGMADTLDHPDDPNKPPGFQLVANFGQVIVQSSLTLLGSNLPLILRRQLGGAPPSLVRELVMRFPTAFNAIKDELVDAESKLWSFAWDLIKGSLEKEISDVLDEQ